MEGFYNLSVRRSSRQNDNLIHEADHKNNLEDGAYNSHGDFTTGVYLVNLNSNNFQKFSSECVKIARDQDFYGFEDEYFMTLHAASIGDISAVRFNSQENLFDSEEVNLERERIIAKQVQSPLRKLSNTSVAPMFGYINISLI